MTQLNQIIAVVNGKKTRTQTELGDLYKVIQKPELFNGLSRTYKPLDDEGETQPSETKKVQLTVKNAVSKVQDILTETLDLVYTQDKANCLAKADIVVGEQVVAKDVPVTHLLFLEKQLVDIRTFISHLPTLDPTETWFYNENAELNTSGSTTTNRSKKVMKNHVKAKATDKHPEQVDVYTEDVKVGEWTAIKFSGAISAQEKNSMFGRVNDLIDAVKAAREKANSMEIKTEKIAKNLFNFVFSK